MKNRSVIKIESVAFGGSGVGRADNLVVFVPFSAPGDELEIEITQRKKNFLRGRIRNIIKPSPWRTDPVCRYYGVCGGCCYQHIHYAYQLAIKKKQVEDAFRRIGKVDAPPVLETVASPRMYHYRGKARYHVGDDPQTGHIGFLDISGGKIVDIEHCAIMQETINEQLSILRENRQNLWHKDELTIWSRYPD
ncbi:MAG: class I SAM-dependent RNA methyltransferase, partial [Deltaproteobacteria bacterium]|nr:class I SAM-dependent RNA methyltransferase [Deltaproteobacteria bacterium]